MSRISVKIAADTSELVRLQTEAKRFSSRFKQAFEFTSGVAAFGGLAAGVNTIKEGFEDAIRSGVNFNAQMQDARIGVAAVLRQFNPGQFTSFSKAMLASGDAIDLLKERAKKSPATFQELVGAFQGLSGAASAAGINTKRQVDLVVLMSQTLAGLGIRSEQILQESRALLTGNITEDAAAARILGITKAQIENATKQGKLYEFLVSKMSGFSEAAEVGSQSYTTALSNMEDSTQQLFAELSEPIFETLRQSILDVNETLGSVEFKSALRPFFEDAEVAIKVFTTLAKWTQENAETISTLARSVGKLGAAYVALKLGDWILTMGREIAARKSNVSQIAQETQALNLNTRAKERNAAAAARANAAGAMPAAAGASAAAGALPAAGRAALPAATSITAATEGALKIGDRIAAMGRELAAAKKGSASQIAQETQMLNLNTIARERNAAASLGSGAVAALPGSTSIVPVVTGASSVASRPALPASTSIAPVAAGALPALGRGGAGRGFIDIESEVTSTVFRAQAVTQAAARGSASVAALVTGMFSNVGGFFTKIGRSFAASPLIGTAAVLAGWELGKVVSRQTNGYNGEEDLAKGEDYKKQWNVRAKAFYEQQNAVTSIIEKEKYLSDLADARAEIEEQLAKESAPLLRGELSAQLKIIDAMVSGAERINELMMRRNQTRLTADAAKSKKEREAAANAANYDEGKKTFATSTTAGQITALEKEIAKVSNGRSESELLARYNELQKAVEAGEKVTADFSQVARAKYETRQAEAKYNASKRAVAAPMAGPGGVPIITAEATPEAQAALDAAKKKEQAAIELYGTQVRANQAAVSGSKAEAEAVRKTIEQLKQLQKLKEEQVEVDRERQRLEESVASRGAEASGNFGRVAEIRERQEREDFANQLRKQNEELKKAGRPQMDVDALMAQYDTATNDGRNRARQRADDEISIREMEASGDFAGAGKLRRRIETQDYADNLRKQGFAEEDVETLKQRQESVTEADQAKGLRRFNLEQRALELRAAGTEKGDKDATAIDQALKNQDMSERIQRDFGLDPTAARALADKRMEAELMDEQRKKPAAVSSLQRIGGGGGVSSAGDAVRTQLDLMKQIRDKLDKLITVSSDNESTKGSDIGQF